MILDDIHRGIKKNKSRKRLGRGPGSGQGKTAGRGHKGQYSRSGSSAKPSFEGGKMPLIRRVPKRGFNNKFAKIVAVVNVRDLEVLFATGEEVTPEGVRARGLARHQFDELKVLGTGDLTKKLKVSAHRFSRSAAEKIEQAGGQVVVLPGPAPVVKQKPAGKKRP
jgi:large subunit ribosomal protein L15